ncbi:MAG: glutamate racemase [bacterium]
MIERPIGVFDSGIGGLTVVAALRRTLPAEKILYLGDTARVPYGGKSPETVTRYSKEISDLLVEEGAKMIVAACNTASALAVPSLALSYPVPFIGVIEPGAAAAVLATHNGKIGVIATRATIASDAYGKAIRSLSADIEVTAIACPLLVPLIEEGLLDDEITRTMLRRYLEPLLRAGIDTLVLGCTHYPLLKGVIGRICGKKVTLVDSAENCALAVRALISPSGNIAQDGNARLDVMLTDSSEGFLRIAEKSLNLTIDSLNIRKVGK